MREVVSTESMEEIQEELFEIADEMYGQLNYARILVRDLEKTLVALSISRSTNK